MKKTTKKLTTAICSGVLLSAVAFGGGLLAKGNVTASANGDLGLTGFQVASGAIRLDGENSSDASVQATARSIRYRLTMSTADYNALTAENGTFTTGVCLQLTSQMEADEKLTQDNDNDNVGGELPADAWKAADEGYEAYFFVYNIPLVNNTTEFSVSAYITQDSKTQYTATTHDWSLAYISATALTEEEAREEADPDTGIYAESDEATMETYAAVAVTFDAANDTTATAQNVRYGTELTAPEAPERDFYKFVEWQVNGEAYDFSSKVTAPVTLTAKWEDNSANYTKTLYNKADNSVVLQETLKGEIGETVSIENKAYKDEVNKVIYALDSEYAGNVLSDTLSKETPVALVGYVDELFAYGDEQGDMGYGVSADGNLTMDTIGSDSNKWVYTEQATTEFTISAKFTAPAEGYNKGQTGLSVMDAQGNKLTFRLMSNNGGIVLGYNTSDGKNVWVEDMYWDDGQYLNGLGNGWDMPFVAGCEIEMTLSYKDGVFNLTYTFTNGDTTYETVTKKALTFNANEGTLTNDTMNGGTHAATGFTGAAFDEALHVGIATLADNTSGAQIELLSLNMIDHSNDVAYTRTLYNKADNSVVLQENLMGLIGEAVSLGNIYKDETGKVIYTVDADYEGSVLTGTISKETPVALVGYVDAAFVYGDEQGDMGYGVSANGNLTMDTTGSTSNKWVYTSASATEFTISAKFTAPTTGYSGGETGFSVKDAAGNQLTFMLTSWNNSIVLEGAKYGSTDRAYWADEIGLGVADSTHTNWWNRTFETGDETTMTLSYKDGVFNLSYTQVNGNKVTVVKKSLSFDTDGTVLIDGAKHADDINGNWNYTDLKKAGAFSGALQVGFGTMNNGSTTGMQIELLSLSMGSNN